MALKDQPYLPLYVQDVLTDEKLIDCSASAHGVYFRLLCVLHKQDKYGMICLKQKHKQTDDKFYNFAWLLAKQMPFDQKQIQACLQELYDEGVINIEDDKLFQKRMVKDGSISLMRAEIGKTGGSAITKQYGVAGFLYWMTDYKEKNKIGVSLNPLNRLYRVRSDYKLKNLFIEKSINVENMGLSEDIALDYFKGKREGEWLTIPYEEIKSLFFVLEQKIKAKTQANAENENENENESVNGL